MRHSSERGAREIIDVQILVAAFGPVSSLEAVDDRDVRMIQRGQRLRFTLEPSEALIVLRERFGQNLDRNLSPQVHIARAILVAHAAFADERGNFVPANPSAGGQRHCRDCERKRTSGC